MKKQDFYNWIYKEFIPEHISGLKEKEYSKNLKYTVGLLTQLPDVSTNEGWFSKGSPHITLLGQLGDEAETYVRTVLEIYKNQSVAGYSLGEDEVRKVSSSLYSSSEASIKKFCKNKNLYLPAVGSILRLAPAELIKQKIPTKLKKVMTTNERLLKQYLKEGPSVHEIFDQMMRKTRTSSRDTTIGLARLLDWRIDKRYSKGNKHQAPNVKDEDAISIYECGPQVYGNRSHLTSEFSPIERFAGSLFTRLWEYRSESERKAKEQADQEFNVELEKLVEQGKDMIKKMYENLIRKKNSRK